MPFYEALFRKLIPWKYFQEEVNRISPSGLCGLSGCGESDLMFLFNSRPKL